MNLIFDDIKIKNKILIKSGQIELNKNEITLIMGKNGTGKTLLLSYISESYKDKMTLVSQNNNEILTKLNIRENMTLTLKSLEKKALHLELLNQFNCEYLLHKNPKKLSGGEKRILSIIRGLCSDSPIIMIDEPTNDLDYKKVNILLSVLREMSSKKSLLIVTHDDRLNKIANSIYKVEDSELIKKKNINGTINNKTKSFEFNNSDCNHFKNNKIQKIFCYNIIYILLLIFYSIFTYFIIADSSYKLIGEVPSINPNQIEIISPMTLYQQRLPDALPIGIFELIDNSSSFPNRREVEEFVNNFLEKPYTLSLEFEDTESFQVFPIEYWSPSRLTYVSPGDLYLRELLDDNQGLFYINTCDYFIGDWNFNFGTESIDFDPEYYQQATDLVLELYNDDLDPLRMTYVVLLLNEGYEFWDFIESDYMNSFIEGSFFIRSNEIIEIINQIHFYSTLDELRNNAIGIGIIIFLIQIFYSYLYLKSLRKEFTILRNYGFQFKLIRKKFNRKFCSWMLNTIVGALFVYINIWLIRGTQLEGILIAYLPGLVAGFAIFLANIVTIIMNNASLKKIYRWRTR